MGSDQYILNTSLAAIKAVHDHVEEFLFTVVRNLPEHHTAQILGIGVINLEAD
jgi:hypothetical protein